MSFVYPSFLFALTALSIPIIVHLFNFRRYKKVYFTNVKFLKEVQQESKAKSTLKRILILISRILALSCLILAFAQPYLPGQNDIKKGPQLISLYIDNSFSMQAVNKSGNLLEDAKRKAREMVQAAPASDKFQLLTNNFNSPQLSLSKEQALDAIDRVQFSPAVKTIAEVYARMQSDLKEEEKNAAFYLLSDFQKTTFSENDLRPDSIHPTSFIYLENPISQNVHIDSCSVESPYFQAGSTQKLHVRIKNGAEKDIEAGSLKFFLNNKQVAPVSFKVPANGFVDVQLSFTCKDTGIQQGLLAIEDFPVTFDDTLYFSFKVNTHIPCLVINGKEDKAGTFLKSLFSNDSLFSYTEQNELAIDYAAFARNNIIVLNGLTTISSGLTQELRKFTQSGGSVLLFPARTIDVSSYNALFSVFNAATILQPDTARQKLDNKNLPTTFYEGVFEKKPENMDMPLVNFHYSMQGNTRSGEEMILRLTGGQSFLSRYTKDKGKFYVCSAPLDENSSSFAKHALFVPTIIKVAVLSRPSAPLYHYCGDNEAIDVSLISISGEKPLHIRAASNSDFIPETKITETNRFILTHGQPALAGSYFLMHDKTNLQGLAFNYKRKESELACFGKDELEGIVKKSGWKNISVIDASSGGLQASLADISGGTRLWKLFVLLTLLFLLAETALIKFMR